MRHQPGKHLTQAGVDLARRVGSALGPYDRIVTSDVVRAYETAIAMGFAVDEQLDALGGLGKGVDDEVDWQKGCAAFASAALEGGPTARAVFKQAELLRSIADSLPENGRALVVSHGGVIEEGVVGLLPDLDYAAWGKAFWYCEGVRLVFDGAACVSAEPLRLAGPAGRS
jgi:broad specificity phosphatase PhoE